MLQIIIIKGSVNRKLICYNFVLDPKEVPVSLHKHEKVRGNFCRYFSTAGKPVQMTVAYLFDESSLKSALFLQVARGDIFLASDCFGCTF